MMACLRACQIIFGRELMLKTAFHPDNECRTSAFG
jgi:hypothetical protein